MCRFGIVHFENGLLRHRSLEKWVTSKNQLIKRVSPFEIDHSSKFSHFEIGHFRNISDRYRSDSFSEVNYFAKWNIFQSDRFLGDRIHTNLFSKWPIFKWYILTRLIYQNNLSKCSLFRTVRKPLGVGWTLYVGWETVKNDFFL